MNGGTVSSLRVLGVAWLGALSGDAATHRFSMRPVAIIFLVCQLLYAPRHFADILNQTAFRTVQRLRQKRVLLVPGAILMKRLIARSIAPGREALDSWRVHYFA